MAPRRKVTPELRGPVFHLVGDAKFAAFLKTQPVKFRLMVRNSIAGDSATAYLRRHFPQTVAILFYREMTDWPSPNGRYVIRKVFSDEFALSDSKVTRAELIEKESGKVLCDMTADDIGWGRDREGVVLWSPDSKRFAYMSAWMKQSPGKFSDVPPPAPKRKQTFGLPARRRVFCESRFAVRRSARSREGSKN